MVKLTQMSLILASTPAIVVSVQVAYFVAAVIEKAARVAGKEISYG